MDDQPPNPPATEPLGARSATALRELQERAQAAIAARREQTARLEADITAQLDALATVLADGQATKTEDAQQPDRAHVEAKRITAELEDARAALQQERAAWESEREALEKERAVAEADRNTFQVERAAWETERNELAAKIAKLEAELCTAEAEQHSHKDELRAAHDELCKQLAELERNLLDEQAAHDREQAVRTEERAEFQRQLDQSRQKFELALEDVQRFRARVTELEQELARRPETDKADPAELVALRTERDALAARVEQLEREPPAAPVDADAEQEMDDLRRRFELAVEDVRELKTKNAKLEAQLAGSKHPSGGAAEGDGMDWESQKRRLLASLEGGDDDADDPEVQKERATIESTIEMTDAVVAEKDQLIAELKTQLATAGDGKVTAAQAERDAEISKVLDTDAVIAEHRQKIAQLEQEMEGKLRAAELEMSVERAKIARQRAELEELRNEVESQRQSLGAHGSPANPGAPKRRWLSKLGLTGEENT